ncbi:MAG: dipeptidase PepV [Firmicutes bacterium]|nr:dipeptidase PepV [Bacillota bacterium]
MGLYDYLEKNKEKMISCLQGCIRIPSRYADDGSGYPYGQNLQNCLEYVLNLCEEMGFETGSMDGHVGWCEYGRGDEMIAVLGHLDVVPEGEGWTVPPYEGIISDGKIFGRGTIDDKGPVIAALFALKAVKESGLPLNRRVRLIFGLNEETGSADMKYYIKHGGEIPVMGFTPDGEYPVINGEKGLVTEFFERDWTQTGPVRILEINGGSAHNIVPDKASARLLCSEPLIEEILEMAAKTEKIRAEKHGNEILIGAAGVNAHGGTPWEGENAIGRLMLFLSKLPVEGEAGDVIRMLAQKIGMEYNGASMGISMEDELSGFFIMNLGVITADEKSIQVKTNYRYPVTGRFEDCGPKIEKIFGDAGFRISHLLHKQALYMDESCQLVQKLLEVYRKYTGDESAPKCIGGGTYAKMMPNILAFGPVFPGDEVREHKPDEFIEIERLMDNAKIMADAIYELAR